VSTAAEAKPICVVGNLTLDDTYTGSDSMMAAGGGDALYAALGLRWWGFDNVRVISRVGDDYPPEHLQRMRDARIDASGIRQMPGPTVHYKVTYDEKGERVFEHVTDAARLDELSPTGEELNAIDAARWVHVAAMPIERQAEAVDRARATNVGFSFDPHEEYIAGYESQLRELMDGSVFLPAELEANLLYPGTSLDHALAQILADGALAAAIKRGALGSVVGNRQGTWSVPALSVHAVDPTGAGDAYCGGFIAGFLMTSSALAAAACATVSAAHVIQGFGAFHSPAPTSEWMRASLRTLLAGRFDGEGDRVLARLTGAR
jgi:sugar/nucleoside kinase (ribokinase family)